jgi:heme-degrading monooxygenase HmoA
MYTRLLTFKGATDIDGGTTYLREEVVPILGSQPGYRGVTASANRSANVFGVLSIWETEDDRASSDSALGDARDRALEIVGGNLTVENLEVVAAGAVRPITAECKLLITRLGMDPAKVDDIVAFFNSDVFPVFKAQPGFCGLHNMIDRAAGKAVVGSAWETREAIDAYLSIQPERRRISESHGVRFEEQETREILFTAMK